jgi:hypothetical protein
MTSAQIKAIQTRIGTVPDGFWGPRSEAACRAHLRSFMPRNTAPATNQKSLTDFYGPPGERGGYEPPMEAVEVPFPMFLYQPSGTRVPHISVHKKCVPSLIGALADFAAWSEKDRVAAGLNLFFGCYNPRRMRGGTLPSLHARAAALDFDASRNGNSTHWPTAASMPLEVMEVFARHGWLPAGAMWSRDAMHFQFTL